MPKINPNVGHSASNHRTKSFTAKYRAIPFPRSLLNRIYACDSCKVRAKQSLERNPTSWYPLLYTPIANDSRLNKRTLHGVAYGRFVA